MTGNVSSHQTALWLRPEWQAAALNGVLVLLVPTVWSAYLDYTWEGGRPKPSTLVSSAIGSLPVLLGFVPVALLVLWRTYVHARAYRLTRSGLWRGPAESAGIAGGIALTVMILQTTATWSREPFLLVLAYIAFYVGATALVGLVLGVLLAATALFVLHLRCEDGARRTV